MNNACMARLSPRAILRISTSSAVVRMTLHDSASAAPETAQSLCMAPLITPKQTGLLLLARRIPGRHFLCFAFAGKTVSSLRLLFHGSVGDDTIAIAATLFRRAFAVICCV